MNNTPQRGTPTAGSSPDRGTPTITRWVGWIMFAGALMIVNGAFAVTAGAVALADDGLYEVRAADLVLALDYDVWGWIHLLIGVVALAAGVGLLAGRRSARVPGVVVASLSAVVNFAFCAAQPLWAATVIAVDVTTIYAIVVHGHELES